MNMDQHIIKNRLRIAVIVTFVIMILEGSGGVLSKSLALLSDAVHMLIDAVALSLAWFAIIISERPSTDTKSFGYHRVETLVAFLNGLLLFFMAIGIFIESIKRLWSPQEIHEMLVIWVAFLSLVANLVIMFFLRDSLRYKTDLNIKSAFFHVLGDSLASVSVIISATIIHFTGWLQLDAAVGTFIGFLILFGSFKIISDSLQILLEGVPKNISLSEVRRAIIEIPSVENIHELHIWCICSNIYVLSAHALIRNEKDIERQSLLEEIRTVLKERFGITHSTVQLETVSCGKMEKLCDIKH